MINSANTLECLRPKLTMDKFNSTTTTTKLLSSPLSSPSFSQTRTFVTFGNNLLNNNSAIDLNKQKQEHINGETPHLNERVKVQHLENHTKLQNNNCWNNFRTLCNNSSASSGIKSDTEHVTNHCEISNDNLVDVINVEDQSGVVTAITPLTNNIQSKSAFKLDLNKMKNQNNTIYINKYNNIIRNGLTRTETNNNAQVYLKHHNNNQDLKDEQTPQMSNLVASPSQRTEDQNNAFRHIESVHNYAKLKLYDDDRNDDQSPHGSRDSSYLDEEEDDEVEDDEGDNENEIDEEYDDGDIGYEEHLELSNINYPVNFEADYEDIFNRNQKRLQKFSTSSDGGTLITRLHNSKRANESFDSHGHINVPSSHNRNDDEEEPHIDVDVETVEANSLSTTQHTTDDSNNVVKPDHHARRPMNAFLIFCKRHRAIVKERYKNLENRAITKILGDWWASLDTNDKKCFTNLAQQNKDAFFSANPNFKWYKLPAPPLRTLTTRPGIGFGQDYQEDKDINVHETISNNTRSVSHNNDNNYFKLADEAQMGDLSQLMQDKSKATTQKCADLQQALGETSQFISTHITGTAENLVENSLKRRFHNDNSFSSNSSEEDCMEPKKKSVRSCKGKRYQELINSGQIVTAIKKSKSSTRLNAGSIDAGANFEINLKANNSNLNNNNNNLAEINVRPKRSVSESENIISYELNGFDLEEKIKELPALDLDEYLQRKRNTKKKKKFSTNSKKRGQRNNANNTNAHRNNNSSTHANQQVPNAKTQLKTAVGSQKRKARKESITRRDISVMEQEVAPLLPLTINGRCYFQEAPTAITYTKTLEKDTKSSKLPKINVSTDNKASSSIIPLQNPMKTKSSLASVDANTNMKSNNNNNNNNNSNDNTSSSTSDLLILAEVAASSTELKR